MNIDVILLLYILFSALSNSIHFSADKGRYESHDRAMPGGAAAPKIAAPEIYFSLLEAQRGIIPNFFRYINCK